MSVFKLPDNLYDEMTSMVPSPHAFSCFVQRAFHLYFNKPYSLAHLGGSLLVLKAHRFLSFFFADDNIIFCQATREECNHLEQILETYEKASSQKINCEKTSLFFNRNTPQDL